MGAQIRVGKQIFTKLPENGKKMERKRHKYINESGTDQGGTDCNFWHCFVMCSHCFY